MAPTLADTDFALLNISPAPDSYKTPLQETFLTVSPIRLKKCVGSAENHSQQQMSPRA